MIIYLKIKNFRSYKEENCITFEALPDSFLLENVTTVHLESDEKINLLNVIGIFGANASGKSNVIWALHTISSFVKNSRNFDVRTPVPYIPFLFNEQSSKEPTTIELKFTTKGKIYRYSISFREIFEKEALFICHKEKEELIYRIDGTKNRRLELGPAWVNSQMDLSFDCLANQLFLSWMGVRPVNGLEHVYEELAYIDAEPINDSINLKLNNNKVAAEILKDSSSLIFNKLNELVHIADMGILKINMKEHNKNEFNMPVPDEILNSIYEQNRWEFSADHLYKIGNETKIATLPIQLESLGTKNLIGVGARVLHTLNTGGVLAYDEMNLALHSDLFKLLVELFNSEETNPYHAQLLFTTHDVTIARDGEIRADQMWFAEKNKNGESELYSAQDFEDASINMPFEKWYRAGRFGAKPHLGLINTQKING